MELPSGIYSEPSPEPAPRRQRSSGDRTRPAEIRLARVKSGRMMNTTMGEASLGTFADKETSWLKITWNKLMMAKKVITENAYDECSDPGDVLPTFWVYLALLRLRWTMRHEIYAERDRYIENFQQRRNSQDALHTDVSPSVKQELQDLEEKIVFARLAYEPNAEKLRSKLKRNDCVLLQRDWDPRYWKPSYYIAHDKKNKTLYVGIKGSTSIADALTDMCMTVLPYNLNGPFVRDGDHSFLSHDGFGKISKLLADDIEHTVEKYVQCGHTVIIVGHSLGASIAAVLGLILRSRIAASGDPSILYDHGKKIRSIAYGPPPVLDFDSARECEPFTTSVVNNADIVPRLSMHILMSCVRWAKSYHKRLRELGMDPCNWRTFPKFLWMLITGKSCISVEEATSYFNNGQFTNASREDIDCLYVPGKVFFIHRSLSCQNESDDNLLVVNGSSPVLRYLLISPFKSCMDHSIDKYKLCLFRCFINYR